MLSHSWVQLKVSFVGISGSKGVTGALIVADVVTVAEMVLLVLVIGVSVILKSAPKLS